METFHNIINYVSFGLNIIGALITIWGIAISLFEFIAKELFERKDILKNNELIRIKLGSYLVLALEIFSFKNCIRLSGALGKIPSFTLVGITV